MNRKSKNLIRLADLLKENSDQSITPVINPFLAFVLYIVAVICFHYHLWPILYWKICVYFNLLDHLKVYEFLNIASKVSFSTSVMMLFFFFSAGYNTANEGASQQRYEPFPVYQRLVKILNNSCGLTFLTWLICYVFLMCLVRSPSETYLTSTMYLL